VALETRNDDDYDDDDDVNSHMTSLQIESLTATCSAVTVK